MAQAEAATVEPLTVHVPLEELSHVSPDTPLDDEAAPLKRNYELRQLALESLWQSDGAMASTGHGAKGEKSSVDEFVDHMASIKKADADALADLSSAHYGCYTSSKLEKALSKSHWELLTAHVKDIVKANPALRDVFSSDMTQHFTFQETVLPRLDVVTLTNDDSGKLPLTFSDNGLNEAATEIFKQFFRTDRCNPVFPVQVLRILSKAHASLATPAFGVASGARLLYIDGIPIVELHLRWVNSLLKDYLFDAKMKPTQELIAELLSPTNLVTAFLSSQERGSEMQLGFASKEMLDRDQVRESAMLFHTEGANTKDEPPICFHPYTPEDVEVIVKAARGKAVGTRKVNMWLQDAVIMPSKFLDEAPSAFTITPLPPTEGPLRQYRVVLTCVADVDRVVSLFQGEDDDALAFLTLSEDGIKAFAGTDNTMQLAAVEMSPVFRPALLADSLMYLIENSTHALPLTFSFMPSESYATEDDVLVSCSRTYCSMLVARMLRNAVKGMSNMSNYNKTANQRVNGDSASRDVFTAHLPVSFSVEKTPFEFAAVKKLFWDEMHGQSPRCLSSCLPSDILRALRAKEPSTPFELFAAHQLGVEEQRKEEIDLLLKETNELGYHEVLNLRQTVARDKSVVLSSLSGNLRIQSTSPAGCLEQLNVLRCDRLSKYLANHPTLSSVTLCELETWFAAITLELKKASIRRAALRRNVGEQSGKWSREYSIAVLVKELIEEDMNREITSLRHQNAANTLIDRCHVEWGGAPASNVVHFTVMTTQAIADRYVSLKKTLKVAAGCASRGLVDNVRFIDSTKYITNRTLGIEGSVAQQKHLRCEYLAAGVALELFSNISYHGYRPITCHTLRVSSPGHRTSEMRCSVVLRFDSSVLDLAPLLTSTTADFPPMLSRPESWAETNKAYAEFQSNGATLPTSPYLTMRAPLLRSGSESAWLTNSLLQTCVPSVYKTPFVESLDYINSVKWQVSDVAISHLVRVKGRGEDFGDKLRGGYVPILPQPPVHKTLKSMGVWHQACEEMKGKITDRKQAVESGAQVLDLIRRFRSTDDMEHIHLPCNCDFRGRAYPMHTGLNYQASDFVRSSLVFAEKRPITKSGVNHLKIHAANLMGLDKKSFDERIKWCDDNVEEIIKMRDRPYGDDALWRKADKPLLGYVVLCELADALCHSQGIENFETGVPIHVDGSCNGLQHYSAMSLHPKGAATANLSKKTWAESPSDIYTTVLEVVKAKNLAIIEEPSSPIAELATRTHPFLARKTVKQSVMTNVYGVTNLGMRDQVLGQLHPLNESLKKAYTTQQLGEMANHITKLIVMSLTDVFQGAMEIQAWFKVCRHPSR